MKNSMITFISVGVLTAPLVAQETAVKDASKLQAQLITTTVSSGLPAGLDFMDKPFGYKEGASLTYFLQSENIVEFDKKSFQAKGWKLDFSPRISKSGKTASFTILNKKFDGKAADIKLNGTVDLISGSKTESKTLTLKKDADPIQLPDFTVELKLGKEDKGLFGGSSGVKVVGDFSKIKAITLKSTGKDSNGYSSSGNHKTYSLDGLKDGDEVTITYWTDLSKKTVTFSK